MQVKKGHAEVMNVKNERAEVMNVGASRDEEVVTNMQAGLEVTSIGTYPHTYLHTYTSQVYVRGAVKQEPAPAMHIGLSRGRLSPGWQPRPLQHP